MNSRAGYPTYSLSRGASSPLEYYSISALYLNGNGRLLTFGGEEGIRTLVGLPPNGFQDRLVMTTSIPLRVSSVALTTLKDFNIIPVACQHLLLKNILPVCLPIL